MQYHAIQCNTTQCHVTPCNTMQYLQFHAIPCIINNCWRSVQLACGQYKAIFIYWTTRTLIGDNGTLRHSSLEFKVNFCQDKIFAKEILWKVKRSKISTNSPYISNVLRLLKLFDNRQKLKDNQHEQSSIFKHQIPPQLKSIKITGLDSWHCKLTIALQAYTP